MGFHLVRSVLLSAAVGIQVLASGCATIGPAEEARKISGTFRPGTSENYRVDRFRIGWYDSAKNLDTPERLARAGFDSVMPYSTRFSIEEVQGFLKKAEAAGISVHQEIPRARVADPTGESLAEYIQAISGSSAILDWYLYDEPEWKRVSRPKLLETAYSRIKAVDPVRPIALVFILPGLSGPYRGAMDNLWIDYYPVARRSREYADLRGGKYAERMKSFGRRADRYGIPLTIVPQGFGENEAGESQFWRRLPTPVETRYMFWASFLARPVELIYWTLYRTREDWLQDSLVPVVREFRERFPDVVEYFPDPGFRIRGGRADSVFLGNGRGRQWLVILSREGRDRELRGEAPAGYAFGGASGDAAREISFRLESYGVRLLEISEIP